MPKTGRCLFTAIALTRAGYEAVKEWQFIKRSPANYALGGRKQPKQDRQFLEEAMGKRESTKYAAFLREHTRAEEASDIDNGHIPKDGDATLREIAKVLEVRLIVHFGDCVTARGKRQHLPVHVLHTLDHFDCLYIVPDPSIFEIGALKIQKL